jgi:hypothetical protein
MWLPQTKSAEEGAEIQVTSTEANFILSLCVVKEGQKYPALYDYKYVNHFKDQSYY